HSVDPHVLRQFLLEDLDPDFAGSVRDGDILVAGHNFGCGSAMELGDGLIRFRRSAMRGMIRAVVG
ncbi:hypothetical protein AB4Z50_36030, partial [Paenibacillus sp. 2TAB26]